MDDRETINGAPIAEEQIVVWAAEAEAWYDLWALKKRGRGRPWIRIRSGVTRRDGENLVLMSQRDADAREQLLQFAAELIAVAIDERGSLAERMANAYPWMLALGQADRECCARDLVGAARASFATGHAHLIAAELTSWRETASALAAGLRNSPVDWLDDDSLEITPMNYPLKGELGIVARDREEHVR